MPICPSEKRYERNGSNEGEDSRMKGKGKERQRNAVVVVVFMCSLAVEGQVLEETVFGFEFSSVVSEVLFLLSLRCLRVLHKSDGKGGKKGTSFEV